MGRVPSKGTRSAAEAKSGSTSGRKQRSADEKSRGASRVEPSKITQQKRDDRERKTKQGR
ncbi:MAG: hypothetical protein AB7G11_02010 [Phycisphaerales bacterium]